MTADPPPDAPRARLIGAELRRLFENSPMLIVVLAGRGHVVEYANAAFVEAIGTRRLVGRPIREAFPEPQAGAFGGVLDRCFATGEPFTVRGEPSRLRGLDGAVTTRFFDFVYQRIEDEFGRPEGLVGQGSDVTERVVAERALKASEALSAAILSAALDAVVTIDQHSRVVEWNRAAEELFGLDRQEVLGRDLADLIIPPDLRPAHRSGMATYLATGEGPVLGRRVEVPALAADGRLIPVELAIRPIDLDGAPHFTAFIRDISDRKAAEGRQRLLIHELNHRVKNTLATVQSIAAQTRRTVSDPATAYGAFVERLVALAGSHDVLTREEWRGADLADVVREALRPFGAERFRIEGPAAWLSPQAALAFGMALHELATNAAKYGSLSAPGGVVEVRWRDEGCDQLDFLWREHDGPSVAPPTQKGFGSRLLERLSLELGGPVELQYRPEGVVCRIAPQLGAPPEPLALP
jgi:PAS domain S-box-containing protein